MAIYVYNTKQQGLNSKKLSELLSFLSNDFGGLISNTETPTKLIENSNPKKWEWDSSLANESVLNLVGGGISFDYQFDSNDPNTFNPSETYPAIMYGFDITIPSKDSSILTDVYSNASLRAVGCQNIEEVPLSEEYEELTQFYITGAVLTTPDKAVNFYYYGNTYWIDEDKSRFFIPICGLDANGSFHSMIFNRDKSSYESFLTARTYYQLLRDLGEKFVWRTGGESVGDIGQLNITDNIITNKDNESDGVEIIQPLIECDELNTESFRYQYKPESESNRNHILANQKMDRLLLLGENGKIKVADGLYKIPVSHGGTGGGFPEAARENINILFGSADPNQAGYIPYRLTSATNPDGGLSKDVGALYFKILTESSDKSIKLKSTLASGTAILGSEINNG